MDLPLTASYPPLFTSLSRFLRQFYSKRHPAIQLRKKHQTGNKPNGRPSRFLKPGRSKRQRSEKAGCFDYAQDRHEGWIGFSDGILGTVSFRAFYAFRGRRF
jgi:hypothetical protein